MTFGTLFNDIHTKYTPEFPKCAVDFVAATIAVQAGENPGGLDTPALDG